MACIVTVLLVDSDPDINKINQKALRREGYEVLVATTLRQAESILLACPVDVVILDMLLPDGSGLDLCKRLTCEQHLPVLFLTALSEVPKRVEGLKAGGDDYLTKPYHIDELCARVEALIRRASPQPLPTKIGKLEIDHVSQRVYLDGIDALLKPREFALFRLLLQSLTTYLSAEDVYHAVWGAEAMGDVRTVYAHMSRLRKKLSLNEDDDTTGLYLEHNRNKGYRIIVRKT